MKQIGWFAMIPFIIADVGNLVGGYFTQFIIKRGVAIPKARIIAVSISAGIMGLALFAAPFIITTPMTALIIFGIVGFGYTSYTANALAIPADIVPASATASVWGLACIGTGLGGALFQSISGVTLKTLSISHSYPYAYNALFYMFGVATVIGLLIMLFFMGPLVKNKELQKYVEN